MKIVYLANIRMPSERANAIQIVQMCNAFVASGHSTVLLATSRDTHIKNDPEDYYQTKFNFTLEKTFVPAIVSWGAAFFHLANLIFILGTLSVFKKHRPEIIYCRDEWTIFLLSLFISKRKFVYESHEARYSFPVRYILCRGVRCVVISEGIRDFYLQQGVSEEQLLVAHDGIDDSFFGAVETKGQARQRLGIVSAKPVAMYVGGFDKWKGVEVFFQAAERSSSVNYVVIGGSVEEVEFFSEKYPGVTFLGARPYGELKDNQQAADVLVVPNTGQNKLSAEYTSPLKLFAHLAARIPLVVSDIPSLRSVVSEQQVTFFSPDDPVDLAQEIEEVLASGDVVQDKASAAFELSRQYSWSKRAQKIIKFIEYV